jgi:hypothetical protein
MATASVVLMEGPDPDADWWTVSDVAAHLGVSIHTVSSYRSRRQMPDPDRTIGRTPVWRPVRIIDWHAQRPGHGGRPSTATGASEAETAR